MEGFRTIAARVRNWGRWGVDDQRGTLNLIGPAEVAAAAALVRHGRTIALGVPFEENGPQDGKVRQNPIRIMAETGHTPGRYPGVFRFADDVVVMALQAASQWDALAHVHYDGKMYNGYPISHITAAGATRLDVTNLSPGVVGRGVLLDVARHRGVRRMQPGEAISPEELDAVVAAQGVQLRSGDIVLIRTGWWTAFTQNGDPREYKVGEPGLSVRCADWLHRHDVAAVAADNYGVEVIPSEYDDEYMPLHMIALRDMGMPFAEILDFEELGADCAEDGIYEFLLVAPPLLFPRGVGSPINPLAIK